jgi:hypothetical protein
MKFQVEVICFRDDGQQRCSVLEMERAELAMETLGLSVAEGKAMLRGVQDFVVSQQAQEDLKRRRKCPACGQPHHSNEAGTHTVKRCSAQLSICFNGVQGRNGEFYSKQYFNGLHMLGQLFFGPTLRLKTRNLFSVRFLSVKKLRFWPWIPTCLIDARGLGC